MVTPLPNVWVGFVLLANQWCSSCITTYGAAALTIIQLISDVPDVLQKAGLLKHPVDTPEYHPGQNRLVLNQRSHWRNQQEQSRCISEWKPRILDCGAPPDEYPNLESYLYPLQTDRSWSYLASQATRANILTCAKPKATIILFGKFAITLNCKNLP